jgi:hypothetical protein
VSGAAVLVVIAGAARVIEQIALGQTHGIQHSLDRTAGVAMDQYLALNPCDRQRRIAVFMRRALGHGLTGPALPHILAVTAKLIDQTLISDARAGHDARHSSASRCNPWRSCSSTIWVMRSASSSIQDVMASATMPRRILVGMASISTESPRNVLARLLVAFVGLVGKPYSTICDSVTASR